MRTSASFFAGALRQPPEEQVIDDEELGGLQLRAIFFYFTELARQMDFLEECVSLAIQDFVAALHG